MSLSATVRIRALFLIGISLIFTAAQRAPAQEVVLDLGKDYGHLVSSDDLEQRTFSVSAERRQNIETLDQFLSSSAAEKVMSGAHVDPVQVKSALPELSDAELSDLSIRVNHRQHDFAGSGFMSIELVFLIIALLFLLTVATGAW